MRNVCVCVWGKERVCVCVCMCVSERFKKNKKKRKQIVTGVVRKRGIYLKIWLFFPLFIWRERNSLKFWSKTTNIHPIVSVSLWLTTATNCITKHINSEITWFFTNHITRLGYNELCYIKLGHNDLGLYKLGYNDHGWYNL